MGAANPWKVDVLLALCAICCEDGERLMGMAADGDVRVGKKRAGMGALPLLVSCRTNCKRWQKQTDAANGMFPT